MPKGFFFFFTQSQAIATFARNQRYHIRYVQLIRLINNHIKIGCGFASSVAKLGLVIFLHLSQVLACSW